LITAPIQPRLFNSSAPQPIETPGVARLRVQGQTLAGLCEFGVERDHAALGGSAGGLVTVAGRAPEAQRGAG
jgi:hypothetical protein